LCNAHHLDLSQAQAEKLYAWPPYLIEDDLYHGSLHMNRAQRLASTGSMCKTASTVQMLAILHTVIKKKCWKWFTRLKLLPKDAVTAWALCRPAPSSHVASLQMMSINRPHSLGSSLCSRKYACKCRILHLDATHTFLSPKSLLRIFPTKHKRDVILVLD